MRRITLLRRTSAITPFKFDRPNYVFVSRGKRGDDVICLFFGGSDLLAAPTVSIKAEAATYGWVSLTTLNAPPWRSWLNILKPSIVEEVAKVREIGVGRCQLWSSQIAAWYSVIAISGCAGGA